MKTIIELTLPELHPAQQGLKADEEFADRYLSETSRTTSSTTRIESKLENMGRSRSRLPELHPAQQGLKENGTNVPGAIVDLPELHPAQQGLKDSVFFVLLIIM